MPYDSLVALGSSHPQFVVGGQLVEPVRSPVQCQPPIWRDPKAPTDFDSYLRTACKPPHGRAVLSEVHLDPGHVQLHPQWQQTCLCDAIDAAGRLHLSAVTPAMLRSLSWPTRRSLMVTLSQTRQRVRWRTGRGRWHRRRPVFRLPVGRHFRVNAATALVLRMGQDGDPLAFREALLAGLPVVVDELQGARDGGQFPVTDIAWVLQQAMAHVCARGDPTESTRWLDAAGTLVRHYMAEADDEGPVRLRESIGELMAAICPLVPKTPCHVGMALGLTLSGAFKHVGELAGVDAHRRWRVASLANIIWATQNFVPIPAASGAIATAAVGAAIWWDKRHPPRDYTDVVKRYEGEFLELALHKRIFFGHPAAMEMVAWMRRTLDANGF